MRNGEPDKRNGAAECRGRCREQTGDDEQQIAGEFNVYSQIGSITVTEALSGFIRSIAMMRPTDTKSAK